MPDSFPTRQYPYQREAPNVLRTAEPLAVLAPDTLHRFIVGEDDIKAPPGAPPLPVPLDSVTLQSLNDPFARLLRSKKPHPLTARSLVSALDMDKSMQRLSFVIGEGLQIPFTPDTADLARQLRVAVVWRSDNELSVLLSTAPPFDDQTIFLQVIGLDAQANLFNFYERRMGVWSWAGNSRHALSAPTRGKGPFDSHVNGALVMKELKLPWPHWSSEAAFELPGLDAKAPVLQEELIAQRTGAQELEPLVRTGIRRWTRARVTDALAGDTIVDVPALLRHLLSATTVNLVCSVQESEVRPPGDRLPIPITPFLDANLLLDELALPVDMDGLTAPWQHYKNMLVTQGYELRDQTGRLAKRGDIHFAFPAFERSNEDLAVVSELIEQGVLSTRLAACLAMVDFPNPVWSQRREALLRHVPTSIKRGIQGWDLATPILASITASPTSMDPTSPEAEFLKLWEIETGWEDTFGRRIKDYLNALQNRLNDANGFNDIGRLVESQRRRARKRPLLEFSLTLPRATKLDHTNWRMTTTATIERS